MPVRKNPLTAQPGEQQLIAFLARLHLRQRLPFQAGEIAGQNRQGFLIGRFRCGVLFLGNVGVPQSAPEHAMRG